MRAHRGRWIATVAGMALLGVAATAAAKGTVKGTFGEEKFKARRLGVNCAYTRSVSFFTIAAAQAKRGRQRAIGISGIAVDPTAAGALFPIVLTDGSVSFGSGPIRNPSGFVTWGGLDDAVTITLTAFKKGKVIGTMAGTLDLLLGAGTGPISGSASFAVKCLVQ